MVFTLPDGLLLKGATNSPRGRDVAAARAFKPGEVIAVFDSPSIAIPDTPSLATTCSGCLVFAKPGEKTLRACTGCRTAVYCSTTCQRLDWKEGGHKAECSVFKHVRDEGHDILPTPVRALVQVFQRPEIVAAMGGLEGHFDKFRKSGMTWAEMHLQAMGALHYVGRNANDQESIMEAIQILCKLQVNSFSRLDVDLEQTGLYMNPALSMINHSCIPNAFVQFDGRKAVLHAYREIKKDEKVEISYIDVGLPLSKRKESLKTRYHFECDCPRCKNDMDVYQVGLQYPHLDLNSFSFAPDVQKKLSVHQTRTLSEIKSLNATAEKIYPWCATPLESSSDSGKVKELCQRWAACKPLCQDPRAVVAIEPLPNVLAEANIFLCEQEKFAYSLCISSFLATHIDPIRMAAPFAPQRVKGMFMIAKLLANGVEETDQRPDQDPTEMLPQSLLGKISRVLQKTDRATMCQTILELVLHYAPAAHSEEWSVYHDAKNMLSFIESRPGRETQNMLVKIFMRNPSGVDETAFFEHLVLRPLEELSALCLEVMDNQFGS